MNRYDPAAPRIAFGLAAMTMSAITIAVLVVLPSKMEPDSQAFAQLAGASSISANACARLNQRCLDSASTAHQVVAADSKCREQG
jgi:hypothetical protein